MAEKREAPTVTFARRCRYGKKHFQWFRKTQYDEMKKWRSDFLASVLFAMKNNKRQKHLIKFSSDDLMIVLATFK